MQVEKITSTFWERVKYSLVPGPLYIQYRVAKERWRGEREIGLLPFLVDPSRNAIDAGANKGVYTHVVGKLARHTYAYEPNPKMFALLARNATGKVSVFPTALSDKTGRAMLRVPYGHKGHSNQGASLSVAKVADSFTPVEVETARIDDLGLCDIGFIKIDVEEHEDAVLRGARQAIARDRPNLLVEIEEKHTKRPIEDDLAAIEALGYCGLFLEPPRQGRRSGVLRPLSAFDPAAHHRNPSAAYIFNFLFLANTGR